MCGTVCYINLKMKTVIKLEMNRLAEKIGYHTKQRDLILGCLKKHRLQHATADNIRDYLREQGEAIGQTTVYRNLSKLQKEGIVVKYAGAQGQGACFQYVDCGQSDAAHYHLVCIDCGQMIHLECGYLDDMTAHLLEHHQFSIDKYKTVIYGLCNECAAAK